VGIPVRNLRDDLQTLLGHQLGTYTLANGASTPAVSVRADSESLAAGTKVSGLEVVINRHPVQDPVLQYENEECEELWEVWLLAWNDAAPITDAAARVVKRYPGTTLQQITLPESWGPKRQVKITLRNPADLPLALRDVDGGEFGRGLPATLVYLILDGGNITDGTTANTYTGVADGGVIV
jgi:hypothetical protein